MTFLVYLCYAMAAIPLGLIVLWLVGTLAGHGVCGADCNGDCSH